MSALLSKSALLAAQFGVTDDQKGRDMIDASTIRARPTWIWVVAILGLAWNAFGIVQLTDFVTQTRASLMMSGMSQAAAELYYGLPAWMQLVFAIGSVGGLLGSIALLLRPRLTVPVLGASLIGYVALWLGDWSYGVFDAIPGQMAILTVVVAIAVILLTAALIDQSRGRSTAGVSHAARA